MQNTVVETNHTATVTSIHERVRDRSEGQTGNVVELPPAGDVIASIHIELRRGGKVSHRLSGVTNSNAYRLSSALMRVLAETFQHIKQGR